jgi:transposase
MVCLLSDRVAQCGADRTPVLASRHRPGLPSLVVLSTGETVPTPQHTKTAAQALRRAQRAVARKRRHSKRQRKAKLRVTRLGARIANQRRDHSHKRSRPLVDRFSHIAMEDLNIKGLAARDARQGRPQRRVEPIDPADPLQG